MSFISYAQNFEDVMLWRALKHVTPGFYIDVGANDPSHLSVTRAFYEADWRGINIEPVRKYFELLADMRPRDVNLCMGAGAAEGTLELFDIPDTGLATSDPAIARAHQEAGWKVEPQQMPVQTLAHMCEQYVEGPIHFLKIDVEGAERDVLLGMDFKRWRPWIIVVEATLPLSEQQVHDRWEPLILQAGYDAVYFDGLNRYYVAQEHAELTAAFASPPNPFDQFITREAHEALTKYYDAQNRLHDAETALAQSKLAQQQAEEALAQAGVIATSEQERLTAQHVLTLEQLQEESQAELALAAQDRTALEQRLTNLEQHSAQAQRECAEQLARATERADQAEHRVHMLMSSSSWRMTGPMRRAVRFLKTGSLRAVGAGASSGPAAASRTQVPHPPGTAPGIGSPPPTSASAPATSAQTSLKAGVKSLLRRSIKATLSSRPARSLISNPAVRGRITTMLYRYPALDARVRGMVHQSMTESVPQHMTRPHAQASMDDSQMRMMPRSARRALLAMQRSSKNQD